VTTPATNTVDAKSFWQAIGQRAIGSTIVTAKSGHGPAGLLGLSATHVCAEPPTMLVTVDKRTAALQTILDAKHFAINYLPQGATELADIFGGKTALKGAERFGTAPWQSLHTGAPVLEDAVGAIDCELAEAIERHGVMLLLGTVVATRSNPEQKPLVHFRGGFLS
jgi:flavin reductase (DIM6/NTAB) family NADH-FMN oxidoreductase RutF